MDMVFMSREQLNINNTTGVYQTGSLGLQQHHKACDACWSSE